MLVKSAFLKKFISAEMVKILNPQISKLIGLNPVSVGLSCGHVSVQFINKNVTN